MRREGTAVTVQATGLVHDAFLRLMGGAAVDWTDRGHFFTIAARAMRRILVERARRAARVKHGGDRDRLALDDVTGLGQLKNRELLALDDALRDLEARAKQKHEVVMLRWFAGLTVEETAVALSISEHTVKSDWRFARAWLASELRSDVP